MLKVPFCSCLPKPGQGTYKNVDLGKTNSPGKTGTELTNKQTKMRFSSA